MSSSAKTRRCPTCKIGAQTVYLQRKQKVRYSMCDMSDCPSRVSKAMRRKARKASKTSRR